MSTQLIKPIFVYYTPARSTTEKLTALFLMRNQFSATPTFTTPLVRLEKGKLTKIPDSFLVKSQEINSSE